VPLLTQICMSAVVVLPSSSLNSAVPLLIDCSCVSMLSCYPMEVPHLCSINLSLQSQVEDCNQLFMDFGDASGMLPWHQFHVFATHMGLLCFRWNRFTVRVSLVPSRTACLAGCCCIKLAFCIAMQL
jgi:hypothetical protein